MENIHLNRSSGAIPKFKPVHVQQVENFQKLTSKYLEEIKKEVENNEKEQDKLTGEINKIEAVMSELKELSERPEWPDSFIQINSLAYVPATIIHTGEQYVKIGPEMYALMCLKETLSYLQRKLDRTHNFLDIFKLQHRQLKERKCFAVETNFVTTETKNMPNEIVSNRGIACRTSEGFYEILEDYKEENEKEFYEKRASNKQKLEEKGKKQRTTKDYFDQLHELELQEDLCNELNCEENISERIRMIFRQLGIYNYLSHDDAIKRYCDENKRSLEDDQARNEILLNELIVEALINEPVCSIGDQIMLDDFNVFNFEGRDADFNESYQNISHNDLAATEFLDCIEFEMKNCHL